MAVSAGKASLQQTCPHLWSQGLVEHGEFIFIAVTRTLEHYASPWLIGDSLGSEYSRLPHYPQLTVLTLHSASDHTMMLGANFCTSNTGRAL